MTWIECTASDGGKIGINKDQVRLVREYDGKQLVLYFDQGHSQAIYTTLDAWTEAQDGTVLHGP